MSKCLICQEELVGFTKAKKYCAPCYKIKRKEYCKVWKREYWRNNPEFAVEMNTKRREHYTTYKEKNMLAKAKQRADRFSLDFNIEESDIIIPKTCPVLKKELKQHTRYAPSLDKIDPTKGYTKGNIQVISRKANTMKNDATIDDLKNFARWVRETYGE